MSDTALLKALYEDGEIEKLIAITKNSNDVHHRLFYLHALRKLGEYNIALSYIAEHQMELYSAFGPKLIKLHIDTLFEIKDLDQALNVLKQYETFPYFSLETNEVIAALGSDVQNRRKRQQKSKVYDLKALEHYLNSPDENTALRALRYIENNYSESYLFLLQKTLLDAPSEIVRSFTLLLLIQEGYASEVSIKKFGQILKVIPMTMQEPFVTKSFKALEKEVFSLASSDRDLNLEHVIRNVLYHHMFYIFPFVFKKGDHKLLSHLYLFIAFNMMGRTISLENFMLDFALSENDVKILVEKYKFTSFPLYKIHINL